MEEFIESQVAKLAVAEALAGPMEAVIVRSVFGWAVRDYHCRFHKISQSSAELILNKIRETEAELSRKE